MAQPDSPDPDGSEYGVMEQSETLDEDDMGVDPLEGGMDPPEGWSGADRYGTAPNEQGDERPLDDRLDEERPDVGTGLDPATNEDRPGPDAPSAEMDDATSDDVAEEPAARQDVVVGDELDSTGESQTRRAGHLNPEPDQPAADETVRTRQE